MPERGHNQYEVRRGRGTFAVHMEKRHNVREREMANSDRSPRIHLLRKQHGWSNSGDRVSTWHVTKSPREGAHENGEHCTDGVRNRRDRLRDTLEVIANSVNMAPDKERDLISCIHKGRLRHNMRGDQYADIMAALAFYTKAYPDSQNLRCS